MKKTELPKYLEKSGGLSTGRNDIDTYQQMRRVCSFLRTHGNQFQPREKGDPEMPALNFKKQFAPLVESGGKRQTIRARRKDGRDPRPGQTLYLYTGMRTQVCRKLGEVECKKTEAIAIEENYDIIVGTHGLSIEEECKLAEADGFILLRSD